MAWNVSAYVEKKVDGKWKLVDDHPISTSLKYVVDSLTTSLETTRYEQCSEDFKQKVYILDQDGVCPYGLYIIDLVGIESFVQETRRTLIGDLNTTIKCMGGRPIRDTDGEYLDNYFDDETEHEKQVSSGVNMRQLEQVGGSICDLFNLGELDMLCRIAKDMSNAGESSEVRIVFVRG